MCQDCLKDEAKINEIFAELGKVSGQELSESEKSAVRMCVRDNAEFSEILTALMTHRANLKDPTFALPENIEAALGRKMSLSESLTAFRIHKQNPELNAQQVADKLKEEVASPDANPLGLPPHLAALLDTIEALAELDSDEDGVHPDEGKDSVTSKFPNVTSENMLGHADEVKILREFVSRTTHLLNSMCSAGNDDDLTEEQRIAVRGIYKHAKGFLVDPFPMLFSVTKLPKGKTYNDVLAEKRKANETLH